MLGDHNRTLTKCVSWTSSTPEAKPDSVCHMLREEAVVGSHSVEPGPSVSSQ
jgi:hypothetical protein